MVTKRGNIKKLYQISRLKDGWNGYGAKGYNNEIFTVEDVPGNTFYTTGDIMYNIVGSVYKEKDITQCDDLIYEFDGVPDFIPVSTMRFI